MKKLLLLFSLFYITFSASSQTHKLIVGTFTRANNSEGIYVYNFDTKTAESKALSIIKSPADQGYLALSSDNKFIYSTYMLKDKSAVTAYAFNNNHAEAKMLNQLPAGQNPCYIITDGINVITANYGGGSINVFGVKNDGSLDTEKQLIQHTGSGPDPRQASAHAHQVMFTPDKKYVLAVDLGEDKIYTYSYDAKAEKPLILKTNISTDAGSGPRHLTFSPNGKYVYLAHEFTGKISVFNYHDGNLTFKQQIATTTPNFEGKIDGAAIQISTDGKFLYQTNRGDANTVSIFSIAKNGSLKLIETVSTLGKGPRFFTIDPSGKFLLVAHQYTNDVVIFNRNKKTGKLSDSGKRINVGTPVCLVFSR
ncbi:lactonase family protein [Pedobacter cryotolerans]|uniref:Lactonase family protein n=1 Tax=Pedobacter cryotolerans TaxID=2571270 RepID=A0A4U1CBY2_9SPHI|nr:lactonase family protein [Pedobacter cryotolerans]TKC03586.1 lactonase family protein [Pedobacter cryotolerans]